MPAMVREKPSLHSMHLSAASVASSTQNAPYVGAVPSVQVYSFRPSQHAVAPQFFPVQDAPQFSPTHSHPQKSLLQLFAQFLPLHLSPQPFALHIWPQFSPLHSTAGCAQRWGIKKCQVGNNVSYFEYRDEYVRREYSVSINTYRPANKGNHHNRNNCKLSTSSFSIQQCAHAATANPAPVQG